jgi:hypothetical protein
MRPTAEGHFANQIGPAITADIDNSGVGDRASFAGFAEREAVGERHIRLLAPLAFLSPRIIAVIADGAAPADFTVTSLAKALPYSWAEQERTILRNT